ncbi:hypothetical protein I350_07558 [Cryptococcus amylolentus CBS 6273]|uniref:Uncharacterized protein n=1 Tax=Cryptococcus amylolentus CBS 6273 TaxID=1296118 RepID=A0A1E3JAP9_9TREE|nr:hypothetical protein I350_07558 [Cryptococcus amylolentus CBS 6273]
MPLVVTWRGFVEDVALISLPFLCILHLYHNAIALVLLSFIRRISSHSVFARASLFAFAGLLVFASPLSFAVSPLLCARLPTSSHHPSPRSTPPIFEYYQASCSGSALITLISLSRDLYKQHVHRFYRTVTLHGDNAFLFYREILKLEPLEDLRIAQDEELWKRWAGMVNGGREPDTRLGPHDLRPGKSLLNKLCLYREVDHITMADADAIDDTDEADDSLLDLAYHVLTGITKTTTEKPAPPDQLPLFHHAVIIGYRYGAIKSICEFRNDHMSPYPGFSLPWPG